MTPLSLPCRTYNDPRRIRHNLKGRGPSKAWRHWSWMPRTPRTPNSGCSKASMKPTIHHYRPQPRRTTASENPKLSRLYRYR